MTIKDFILKFSGEAMVRPEMKIVTLVKEHAQGGEEIWEREIKGAEVTKSQYGSELVLVIKT